MRIPKTALALATVAGLAAAQVVAAPTPKLIQAGQGNNIQTGRVAPPPGSVSSTRLALLDAVRAGDAGHVAALVPHADASELADALHLAVILKKADIADVLLRKPIELNQPLHGSYLLETAVRNNDAAMVRVLVGHGAAVDVRSRRGGTLVDDAHRSGYREVETILRSGTKAK